ncbi:hypothetical protein ACFE04_002460 [Oxalis oulophora]
MAKGKFKGKPTGQRRFSTPEEMIAGSSTRPRTFTRKLEEDPKEEVYSEEESEEESGDESEEYGKRKGTQGIIEVENPNHVKSKSSIKARDIDVGKTTELSRREREEIVKQRAHERYMKLQEQGKTDQAKKDLERLALIRQQRAEAAKRREEEKAGNLKKLANDAKEYLWKQDFEEIQYIESRFVRLWRNRICVLFLLSVLQIDASYYIILDVLANAVSFSSSLFSDTS